MITLEKKNTYLEPFVCGVLMSISIMKIIKKYLYFVIDKNINEVLKNVKVTWRYYKVLSVPKEENKSFLLSLAKYLVHNVSFIKSWIKYCNSPIWINVFLLRILETTMLNNTFLCSCKFYIWQVAWNLGCPPESFVREDCKQEELTQLRLSYKYFRELQWVQVVKTANTNFFLLLKSALFLQNLSQSFIIMTAWSSRRTDHACSWGRW